MKLLPKLAVPVLCLVLICAIAVAWHFIKAKATQRKLVEDAKTLRVRAEQGDAYAQYELARLYYKGKGVPQNYSDAFDWYQKAADQGNAKAQYGVGFMYDWGRGVQQDYTQAVNWSRKAADQGYANGQYVLGWNYYYGKGVSQDYCEAARWYRKAADQGYAEAQSYLGYMYVHAECVPQDYTEGVGWYRKAADQGHARAESALGYAYSIGASVPQDYAQSARWYRKAAAQGDDYARRALDAMNLRFTVPDKILLTVTVLGSLLLLINTRESIRSRKQQMAAVGGLLLLSSAGMEVYGYFHYGILLSLSAVSAFFFCKSFLGGVSLAMLLAFVWPQGFKAALGIFGMLFIAFNLYGATHYDLRHSAACPRSFYSSNGLLIGAAITLGILLLSARNEMEDSQNAIGSGTSIA